MSSYVIGVIDKKDLEKYDLYAAAGYQSLTGFEVEISVGENPDVLEGQFPGTTLIVMKFKNKEDAKNWYKSDLYQKAIPLRHAAAGTPFTITFETDD